MEAPKPLLEPLAPSPTDLSHSHRRRCVWSSVIALGVVVCTVVLLLPHKKELASNTATGLHIDGTANLTFWYRNNSHWLPEPDLAKVFKLVSPLLALLESNPKSNTLVFAATNTTVVFRADVWSVKECSTISRALNKSFFTYDFAHQLCYLNNPPPSMVLDVGSADSTSKTDCLVSCNRTLSCMGMLYKSQECTLFKAATTTAMATSGWIVPSLKVKSTNNNPTVAPAAVEFVSKLATKVHVYGTAHQDDHELFMANALYTTFQERNVKAVFVYTSAGDANRTDGWWEAREVGTLAVTDFCLKEAGFYTTNRKDEVVSIYNHTIGKVTIGNAVHYFLRLSEFNLTSMMAPSPGNNAPYVPLGALNAGETAYSSLSDVLAVIRYIVRKETAGVPSVSAFVPEFIDKGNDHQLHVGTGKLFADALAAEPGLQGCVTTTTFYGYQHWLEAINMKEPMVSFQRRVWLALAAALDPVYPGKDVWSNHVMNLGRTYVARVNASTPGVQCTVA
ncbi:hypothetical protein DYB36_007091 [Aphanomyces astaci]|uniref:Apple domain-containing protein n=4 Tax=Aphanomyces astaci TaxID=112090 RepID=A0A396ZSD4_APHAT|nr:hypothetical protein DYB36_007091 [Aphanomyces astaci]